ncbi:MAG: AAA-like domain-containing protein [Lachnospiraceae bacterium]|nr:AAA-like domain-containing protein [Lachnospiraceae bacterium]
MPKIFNTTGACSPARHYMVGPQPKLKQIKAMVDAGDYFSINRARQYGKTTILHALTEYLKDNYLVISLDFQKMTAKDFSDEPSFVRGLAREIHKATRYLPRVSSEYVEIMRKIATATATDQATGMTDIFDHFSDWCRESVKPIVLLIDEVDTASNNQVFLDFLALLRAYYLDRDVTPTFQSVILAGVYDIRNLKRKIRPDENHKQNSPWNIAAKFRVDLSFSANEIAGMLEEYEADYHTGMSVQTIADLMFEYTFGYPYLVSDLCKVIDEELAGSSAFPKRADAWTKDGFEEAVKRIIKEDNPLYESLLGKLTVYPELKVLLQELLFNGVPIPYVATTSYIKDASMFGFIRNENESAVISNRIFESVLYNAFISEEFINNRMYSAGIQEKNQFITGGHLDVRRILERFIETFHELYGTEDEKFLEKVGRKYFLLFLKPIINGAGNYSIEPQTRNSERMDLVIYYRGEQNILELKLWRGNAYNQRGERQLSDYLDYFHMKKGYMLSFNFNKTKQIGIKEIALGDKVLIEAVV